MKTATQHITNWALCTALGLAVLFLNAYLEHKHSETDAAQRVAEISNDRAAEHAAMKGPK
jgi:hypothetical protein